MKYLPRIDSPEDLRKFSPEELSAVATELREFILQTISAKGGHLSSNLGSVELTVGLHYAFDTPRDKVVWDVGHQSYGHKVLTGRRDSFHTIRQFGGLAGFTCRSESEYDHFGAGHASTALSAALGIAEGLKFEKQPNLAIAVVGDGALTGGLCYEAMNNAGHIEAKNLVVILNDNDMSIDPNVGAIQKFITKAVTNTGYNRLRKDMKGLLSVLSEHGLQLEDLAGKVRKSVKNFFTPGMLFECFGFRYFGPIDGHNLDEILKTFAFIKEEGPSGGPYLVHCLTKKGCGYKLAEEMPVKYHGVNPFKIAEGIVKGSTKSVPAYQDIFANTLIELAKEDPRILAITAAMPSGTGIVKFQEQFPNRTYDVGIAEAHGVLFGAGLATEGFRPVVAIYSTFLQRAYDQIIHDVAIQNLPVVFCLDRAGCVGADGATHQGQYDLTYLRTVPNFVIMAPKDENELQHMIQTAIDHDQSPTAIRYPRGPVVGVTMDEKPRSLPIGKGELLKVTNPGRVQIVLIGIGFAVQSCLEAQSILETGGVSSAVINARFVKPLDEELICEWSRKATLVVTVEENSVHGGFGAGVLEVLSKHCLRPHTLIIGMPDQVIEHGTQSEQRESLLLDGAGIVAQIRQKLEMMDMAENLEARPTLAQPFMN